jgi:hypothetical protein
LQEYLDKLKDERKEITSLSLFEPFGAETTGTFDDDDFRDRGFMWGDDFLIYPKIVAPSFDFWG